MKKRPTKTTESDTALSKNPVTTNDADLLKR
jgi:hypothetical protein